MTLQRLYSHNLYSENLRKVGAAGEAPEYRTCERCGKKFNPDLRLDIRVRIEFCSPACSKLGMATRYARRKGKKPYLPHIAFNCARKNHFKCTTNSCSCDCHRRAK